VLVRPNDHPTLDFRCVGQADPFERKDNRFEITRIEPVVHQSIVNGCDCFPNSGTCAIGHLLSLDIKSLFVCGFTFFVDGYRFAKDRKQMLRELVQWNHNPRKQLEWFRRIEKTDPRVDIAASLMAVLANGPEMWEGTPWE